MRAGAPEARHGRRDEPPDHARLPAVVAAERQPGTRLPQTAALVTMSFLLASCGTGTSSGAVCRPTTASSELPPELVESSGVAVSLEHPGVLWTHQDKGSVLFAVDREGRILARFPVRPKLIDWEDVGLASCPDGGPCLYLEDLGDNYEDHRGGQIVRVPEPDPAHPDTLRGISFPIRFPDGPRDTEAIFVLPGERVFVVTKGRNDPVTVYRYPGTLRPDTVVLQEVQHLTDGPRIFPYQLTGGSVSPGGSLVALRTYTKLRFYRMQGDTLAAVAGADVDLRPFREPQGEGVGIGPNGLVGLTSEGGPGGGPARLMLLHCEVRGP